MNDPILLGVLIPLILAGIVWGILQIRASGKPVSISSALKTFALPLMGIGLVLLSIIRSKPEDPVRLPGDDDLEPDESSDEEIETQGEQVRRVIEEEAERVEEHILEEATDDEVASRGAGLFDPGAS